jgi:cytochrome P450
MAAYRALALFAAHPEQAQRVRAELAGRDLDEPQDLPLLRAGVLESVRLWPTTAVVLRDTTTPTEWDGGTLPAGTALMAVSAFLHRDTATVADADRFAPDRWCDGSAADDWSLIPFSAGPVGCPGRELVLFTTSTFLATLLEGHDARPLSPFPLDERRPLPRALDAFTLRFALDPRR